MANTQAGYLPGYETTFITRAELTDEQLKAFNERITGIIGGFGGGVVLTEDWGKRKLAYPIQKETRGHYTYIVYTGRGDVVAEVERNLRLSENVLRFLTVNLETEFQEEPFRKRRAEIQAAAQKREAEREARREERERERRGHYDDRAPRREREEAPAAAAAAEDTAEGTEE
jgi:small subunit ribosomal protein S6